MTGWEFWTVALCLAVATALVLVRAMTQAVGTRAQTTPVTDAADVTVYKDQLAEVGRDLSRGTIGPVEAERLRVEIGRRLLDADRKVQPVTTASASLPGRFAMLLILALVLPGAVAAYWTLGAPGYPDLALKSRLQMLDEAIAARPGQEAELAALGRPRDADTDAALATELAAMTDPTALRDLFRLRLEAGESLAAVRTAERILAVLGDGTNAADHANLALALVIEAEGYVSPEAEDQLRETLSRDMSNELARYLVGEMFLQGGRYDQTFRFWRPIAEGGNPGSPWVTSILERIEEVAGLAGVRYSLPETGPSSDDMAAAAEMSPEERQAMIEGMVAQLSDRLASEGGTVEEWDRLIRALVVLERKDEAQTIYDEAKVRFAGQAAELSFLKLAAVESGLAP